MDHDGLLPIGMFSRASLLSIRTLRAYHRSGLLVPAVVDPLTGYRSYTIDQLADAAVIVRLRHLDLPLDQVREVLDKRDPDHTRAVLAEHRATMEERLAETERIVTELQSGLAATTNTPVYLRTEPERWCLAIRAAVRAEEVPAFLGRAYPRLGQVAEATGAVIDGPTGALYPEAVLGGDEQVEAVLPVAGPPPLELPGDDVTVLALPAAEVAVLVHAGDYHSIGATYRSLGAWVARHARHAEERVREWYLVGPTDTDDPGRYRTEIAWPVLGP